MADSYRSKSEHYTNQEAPDITTVGQYTLGNIQAVLSTAMHDRRIDGKPWEDVLSATTLPDLLTCDEGFEMAYLEGRAHIPTKYDREPNNLSAVRGPAADVSQAMERWGASGDTITPKQLERILSSYFSSVRTDRVFFSSSWMAGAYGQLKAKLNSGRYSREDISNGMQLAALVVASNGTRDALEKSLKAFVSNVTGDSHYKNNINRALRLLGRYDRLNEALYQAVTMLGGFDEKTKLATYDSPGRMQEPLGLFFTVNMLQHLNAIRDSFSNANDSQRKPSSNRPLTQQEAVALFMSEVPLKSQENNVRMALDRNLMEVLARPTILPDGRRAIDFSEFMRVLQRHVAAWPGSLAPEYWSIIDLSVIDLPDLREIETGGSYSAAVDYEDTLSASARFSQFRNIVFRKIMRSEDVTGRSMFSIATGGRAYFQSLGALVGADFHPKLHKHENLGNIPYNRVIQNGLRWPILAYVPRYRSMRHVGDPPVEYEIEYTLPVEVLGVMLMNDSALTAVDLPYNK